jgi:Flp pilus assembly protein TadD
MRWKSMARKRSAKHQAARLVRASATTGPTRSSTQPAAVPLLERARLALLALAVLLAYQPAWSAGFIWDDDAHITPAALRSMHGLWRIWFEPGTTQQYYPLTETFFWVQHKLWGDYAPAYHLTNIALHLMVVVLFERVLRALAVPGAFLAAAVFALHPIHAESVAWVTEQKNTLSTTFYLAAVLMWLRFDDARERRYYSKSLTFGVLAVLSKVTAVTLPVVLLLLAWWKRGRLSWKRDGVPLVPFFAASAITGLISMSVEHALVRPDAAASRLSVIDQILVAGRASWFYLGKLFWPADVLFFYPRWEVSRELAWQYAFPLGLLGLLIALWAIRSRSRAPLAALLFFLVSLFPTLGFLDVYAFIYSFVANHWAYVASMGVIAATCAGIATLLATRGLWARPATNATCAAFIAVLGVLTFRQAAAYADSETLYRTAIEGNPQSWLAHNNLAGVLFAKHRYEQAVSESEVAVRLMPNSWETHSNLAISLDGTGEIEGSIAHFKTAVELKPEHAQTRYRLASALANAGHTQEAIGAFEDAMKLAPPDASSLYDLGRVLSQEGRITEAVARYEQASKLNPNSAEIHNNLGSVLARVGRFDEAIDHYEKSLQIHPNDGRVLANLAKVQSMRGQQ